MVQAVVLAVLAAVGLGVPAKGNSEKPLPPAPLEIFLKPGGTLSEAMEEVASARAHNSQTDIVLTIETKGIAMKRPLFIDKVIASKDFGKLTIRGAKGMRPKILGSMPVKGWERVKKMNGRSDVWCADISAFEISQQLDALFMDGKLLTLARYPNFNPDMPYSGGWAYVPGRWISMYKFPEQEPAGDRTQMLIGENDWHDWSVPSEGRIVIFPRQRYGSSYVPIADVDREAKKVIFGKNLCDVPRPGDTYILSGFREEMDVPGEWFHDLKEQKLYLIPPKGVDPNKHLITVPDMDCVVELNGAQNVALENLEICAGQRGVLVKGGGHVSIRGCSFHDLAGRYAVEFAWSGDNELRDSDLFDLGHGAMHITGGGINHPNVVENCYIHHVSKFDHNSAAIFMEGQGYKIRHNLFHDLPGWAVFHTGNHHELTDNRVHHYMLETEDGGAFYTCNANGGIETTTARNWISDGFGFAKCAGWGPLAFYNNSHGLYFDAGPNHGYVYDNVIERVSGMAFKVDGNNTQVISNNVCYYVGRPELLYWSYAMNLSSKPSKGHDDFTEGVAYSNKLVHNIWYYPNCPNQIYVLIQGADCTRNTFDYNWICPGKDADAPRFRDGITWKDHWTRKWGLDKHSYVCDNIGFKDPKNGDFTPKNHQLMKKLGIHPLVMKKAGLYANEFRPKIPKEAEGCAQHPEWIKNPKDHVNPPPVKKSDPKKKTSDAKKK